MLSLFCRTFASGTRQQDNQQNFIRLCGFKVIRLCGIYRNLRKSEATVQPYNPKTEEVEARETSVRQQDNKTAMNRIMKWMAGIFLAPVILVLLLAVALYLPPVQNWVADKAAEYASEATGMEITVERVCLVFPLDLGVDGVRILRQDKRIPQRKDTIADMRRAVVDVRLIPLFSQKIEIDRLDIYDLKLNTSDMIEAARVKGSLALLSVESHGIDLGGETVRLDKAVIDGAHIDVAMADSVPEDTTESENRWKISLDVLNVTNSDVTVHTPNDTLQIYALLKDVKARQGQFDLLKGYYDVAAIEWSGGALKYDNNYEPCREGLDFNHVALENVNIALDSLRFHSPDLRVTVRKCDMKEKSGLTLASLTGGLEMDSTQLRLDALRLATPTSELKGDVCLDLNVMDERNPGKLETALEASLSKDDLLLAMGNLPKAFCDQWPDRPLAVKAKVVGNMRRVDVRKACISLPQALDIRAEGGADYPSDMKKIRADIRLDARTENLSFLKTLLSRDLQQIIHIPPTHAVAELRMRGKAVSATFDVREGRGKIEGKASYDMTAEAYSASVSARAFQIQHYVRGVGLGDFSGKAEMKGRGLDFFSPRSTMSASARVEDFRYGKWNLDNVSLTASLANGRAKMDVSSENNLIDATIALDALMSMNPIQATLSTDIRHADLHAMKIAEAPLAVSGCAHIDIATDMGEYYMVQGTVGDISIISKERTYHPDDMIIDLLTRRDTTHAVADCGDFHLKADIDGGYRHVLGMSDKIMKEVGRQWAARDIDGQALRQTLPIASVYLSMGKENPVARALERYGLTLAGAYADIKTSPETGINGEIILDTLKAKGVQIDNIKAALESDDKDIRYRLDVKNGKDNPQYAFTAVVDGMIMPDGVSADMTMEDRRGRKIIDLSTMAGVEKEGIRIAFADRKQTIGYKDFAVNSDNYIFLAKDMRVSADVKLRADGGRGMQIYTYDDNLEALQDITFSLSRLDLAEVLSVIPYMPKVSGVMDGDFHVIQTPADLSVSSSVAFENLIYEGCHIGNISSEFVYIPMEDGTHHIDGILMKDDVEIGSVIGGYNPENGGTIDLAVNMQKMPLGIINGFIPDQIIGLEGTGEGVLTVKGSTARPVVDGELFLQDAALISVPYGIRMRFDDDPVRVIGSKLLLENFQMYAGNNQPLVLMGYLDFANLDNITADLRMMGQNLLIIDVKETSRSEAYGKAYVNFYGKVSGALQQLDVRGKLEVLPTTNIYYILRDSPITTDNRLKELVTFTNLDAEEHIPMSRPAVNGLYMDLSVDVRQGAHVTCWLNTNHTNYLDILGEGELRMRYVSDEMQLTGRYTIASGEMKYSLPVIPLKTFVISEGSFLEFTGDMMNPKLHITAMEENRASVDINGVNQIVLFKCGVAISKTLQDMGLEFLIEAPENQTISDELQAKSIEERGKLAVTMLTTGMYLAENNTSSFTMNSALSAFLQSEINNIAGSALRTLDLSVGLENSTDETGHIRTDYAFKFAKRFWNNRLSITVGGKISTGPDVSGQNNTFFDNVLLQYRTSATSNQYLQLFYKRAVYDFLEGYVGEYGAGYMWKRKLQNFKEIFQFKETPFIPAGDSTKILPRLSAPAGTSSPANVDSISIRQ